MAMVLLALAGLALLAGRQPAFAADAATRPVAQPKPNLVVAPDVQAKLPPISPRRAIAFADRTPEVRAQRRRHPDLRPDQMSLYRKSGNWGITYVSGDDLLVDVTVDGRTGEIVGAWQGTQAAWVMARGEEGYFGKTFDEWYVWLPLCLLFLAPFVDPRRPFRMLHVDLLVLVAGFGVSHFFFNKGEIGTSVPLVYPVLAYFLVRALAAAFRPRRTGEPLVPFVPAAVLVAGIVLLGGFRIGLDLVEGKVGDVGYGSAIGATRIQEGQPLYVDSGKNDQHLDTYGPVNYLAYDPFVRIWKPSQQEIDSIDDYELPAARVATLVFDGFTVLGLLLLGMRLRRGREGRLLGLALAYAWVSFPYTLFPLMTNSNDTLISMLVVYALLALTSAPARGALIALAGAAKFAPLALAPLFATGRGEGSRLRAWTSFTMVSALVGLLVVAPLVPDEGGWRVFWDQTIGFQLARESPFSLWGQNPGLDPLLSVLKVAVVGLGILVAFVPRRRDALQVAALGAAVLIATQLIAIHWFYLYIVWFTPFLLVALFGEYSTARGRAREAVPVEVAVPVAAPEHEPELVGAR
jgi:glycosyl transferase family 87